MFSLFPSSRAVWAVLAFWVAALGLIPISHASNSTSPLISPWQKWGPYRPNLYFGVRPQIPDTILMGLMWASGDDRSQMLSSEFFVYPIILQAKIHTKSNYRSYS